MADLTCDSCLQGRHAGCLRSGSCCCSICFPRRYIESWKKAPKGTNSRMAPTVGGGRHVGGRRKHRHGWGLTVQHGQRSETLDEVQERQRQAPVLDRERERSWDHLVFVSDGQDRWTESEMLQLQGMREAGAPWPAIEKAVDRGPHIRAAFSVWKRHRRLQRIKGPRGPYNKKKAT